MQRTTSGERGAAYTRPLTVITKAPSIPAMRCLRVHPFTGALLGTAAALLLSPGGLARAVASAVAALTRSPGGRRARTAGAWGLRAGAARVQAGEARQRAAFLAEASRVLGGSLDYEATLKSMARVAVPYLADYVVVDVLDADGRLRRLAAVHARPELEPPLAEARAFAVAPGAESPVARVLERGESTLVREVDEAWLATRPRDAEHLGARALRPASL